MKFTIELYVFEEDLHERISGQHPLSLNEYCQLLLNGRFHVSSVTQHGVLGAAANPVTLCEPSEASS